MRAARAERGLPADRQGAGVGAQVALARRESPHRGGRQVGFAHARGRGDAAHPGRPDRGGSERVAGHPARAGHRLPVARGPRHRRPAAGRGPGDAGRRRRQGAGQEGPRPGLPARPRGRASAAPARPKPTGGSPIRPAPDTMVHLTALLPVKAGVAAYAALLKAAETARAEGDPRGRGQVMADTLVERVTGRTTATGADLEVQVVITDRTLLARRPRAGARPRLRPRPRRTRPRLAPPRVHDRRHRPAGHRAGAGVAAPALHPPRHRRAGRDGLPPPLLRRQPPGVPDRPRPDLPHPLVRRPDPTRRPRRSPTTPAAPPAPPTARDCASSATTPNKHPAGAPDPPRIATRTTPRRDHHPHRTHLPLRRTTPTRRPPTDPVTPDPAQQDRGPLPRPHPHRLTSCGFLPGAASGHLSAHS